MANKYLHKNCDKLNFKAAKIHVIQVATVFVHVH